MPRFGAFRRVLAPLAPGLPACVLDTSFLSRVSVMNNYRIESPPILRDFLAYHETIKAHSKRTVDEYFLDLRNFFRYLKQVRDPSLAGCALDEIDIMDVDLEFVASVTLTDIYGYMTYLSRDRVRHQNSSRSDYGLNAASRARKIATIRSFYNYLTNKAHLLRENPVKDLDSPKIKKELPKYLTLDESIRLLSAVDGKNQERDYCILTLFLNCGLRISELVNLDCKDIQEDALRVLGKGNKVRILYLNDACQDALKRYLAVRRPITGRDADALFLSSQNERISRSTVHAMVKKRLLEAGLDAREYSSHKLRHTAATLMLQNGVDVRAVQEVLGHDHLNTTEIYTHIDNDALRTAAKANPLSHVKNKGKSGVLFCFSVMVPGPQGFSSAAQCQVSYMGMLPMRQMETPVTPRRLAMLAAAWTLSELWYHRK